MPDDGDEDVEVQVKRVTAAVLQRSGTEVAPETVEEAVRESFAALATARIRDFVPLFAERRAQERVRVLASGSQ